MIREVYAIYDKVKETTITGLRSSKRDTIEEITDLNRRHAHNTVSKILLMKAPKRQNKAKVAEMAQSMADGRYRLLTQSVR